MYTVVYISKRVVYIILFHRILMYTFVEGVDKGWRILKK